MSNRVQFRRYDTPPTNADRIRAMSDEELAWMFLEFRADAYARAKGDEGYLPDTQNGILIWLQQPADQNIWRIEWERS